MAAPTAPTQASLIDEALKLAGHSSPSSSLVTKAESWMEIMKGELTLRLPQGKIKSLMFLSSIKISQGRSKYTMPTDMSYYGDFCMKLMWGSTTGTATAGSTSSVTLAAGDTGTLGQYIFFDSGNAVGCYSQITAVSGQACTLTPSIENAVDANDTYMLIDSEDLLERRNYAVYMFENNPDTQGQPKVYYPYEDSNYGEFYLTPTPNGTYCIPYTYYLNLQSLDLSGTLVSTLYQKHRAWWIKGIEAFALKNKDDVRQEKRWAEFEELTKGVVLQEAVGSL